MNIKKRAIFGFCVVCALLAAAGYLSSSRSTLETGRENAENITVKWMVFGEKYKDSDSIFMEFNRQLQKYFSNTRVEFEVVPKEDYKEIWDMKMATNTTLDLAWIGNDIFNYIEEVKKGSFTALDFLLETYGEDLKNKIPEEMWELQKNEGNTYSIPIPGILYRKSNAVVANKSLAEKYGNMEEIGRINRSRQYTDQECYDSFEKFLSNAKGDRAIGAGVSYQTFSQIADKGYEGIYGADSPFVIKIFEKDLKVYNKYELESWRLYFKTMAEWYSKGYIRQDIMDILNPLRDDGKLNGTILFIDDYGKHGAVESMIPTEYEAVAEPLEDYKYIAYGACRNSIVIPKSADHPERAVEIMNLLISDEGRELYRLLANGISGKHYTQLQDGVIEHRVDTNGNPLYRLSQHTLGSIFQNYEIFRGEFQQIDKYNKNALISPLSGFELDTRMIILEMSKVDLVVDEYMERLCQGTEEDWEKVYEEFISKMRKAGSDKVIQEMQKQVDKFVKNK